MPVYDDDLSLIYKYRSLAGDRGREAAADIILHNRMWWQSPTAFNDPFDCAPVFKFGGTEQQRRRRIQAAAKDVLKDLPRWKRREKLRLARQRSPSETARSVTTRIQGWMAASAVSCFSRVPDNPLMWAHYSDSHKGVCFEFQQTLSDPPFIAYEVQYSSDRPIIDITGMDVDVFSLAVLTKASDWSYEREMRMIDYKKPPGYRVFPAPVLTGIILGARMSDADETFIHELIKKRPSKLAVSRSRLSDEHFRLDIVPST